MSPEKRPETNCACSKGICPGTLLLGIMLLGYAAVALFNWIKASL
jgi:hypothetical protein